MRRAVEEPARQLEIARCLFRESNDALFVFDPDDLRVVDLNPTALRLTGLDRREALALRLTDLIVADAREDLDRLVAANRDTTFFHSREGYGLVRAGGEPVPVNVSVTRVHVEPSPLGLAVIRDVSERRRVQETLDRFFRLSPALFAILDAEGRFLKANPGWEHLLGHHPDDLVGTASLDLVHPADRAATLAADEALRRSGSASFENRCRHRDGSYLRLAWNLASSTGLTYAVATDVTERERSRELEAAKEASEAAGRAKDRFLAVLSHELRTPLNPILLGVTYLLDSGEAPESLRPTFEMIRRNVELEAHLIDDLLDITRILQDKLQLRLAEADTHALIRRAVEVCRAEIDEKGLAIEADLAAGHRLVRADETRLQQVFWNLIKNAVKFTPSGGRLTIRTRDAGAPGHRRLVVEFADTGLGIEPDDLVRIFDPFEQGPTGGRRLGGLGLGLAISRGIVAAHGGSLSATSPGPGRGSTFRVELDALAVAVDAVEGAATGGGGGPRGMPSWKILLVEDETETLDVFARILRRLGHRVATATTLAAAVAAAGEGGFDLIISDVGLPDGSGLDLPRLLEGRRPPPAIAVSGFGMKEDVLRSREAGFAAHLTKPIGFKDLEATIRRVLS
jgi:PAS domain S-box-containing protein